MCLQFIREERQTRSLTMHRSIAGALVAAFFLSLVSVAIADDWVAVKLRGQVFAYDGSNWQPLSRGDVVSDQRPVRTGPSGRVTFQRDAEVIDVASNTQIQIVDKTGRHFTIVKQAFGVVTIDAQVQNVQHFAVQTPQLAAIVKGTRFTVTAGKAGSEVSVKRGHVAVDAAGTHQNVLIAAGQSATVTDRGQLTVKGTGELPDVVDRKGRSMGGNSGSDHGKGQGNSGKGVGNGGGNGTANEGRGNGPEGNSGGGNSGGNHGSEGSENSGNGNGGGGGSDNSGGGNSGSSDSGGGHGKG